MAATQGKPSPTDGHVLLLSIPNRPRPSTHLPCTFHDLPQRSTQVLLSLATAPEGTQLHALATCLSKSEPLSHVLAWCRSIPNQPCSSIHLPLTFRDLPRRCKAERLSISSADGADGARPPPYSGVPQATASELFADLIEMPRLKVTLRTERLKSGQWRVYSLDHANFYLVDTMLQSEASLPPAALIKGAPHALLFRSQHAEYQVLVPNVLPVRPPSRTFHAPSAHLPCTFHAPSAHLPCTFHAPSTHLPRILPRTFHALPHAGSPAHQGPPLLDGARARARRRRLAQAHLHQGLRLPRARVGPLPRAGHAQLVALPPRAQANES